MSFILHIGQSKTGTSSLQLFLAQHRRELASSYGICYPDYFNSGLALNTKEHNSFADSLIGVMRYPHFKSETYFQQFIEQANKNQCEKILLSGESFFGGAPQAWEVNSHEEFETLYKLKLRKLKNLLNDKKVEVIVYLRRQDLWLDSAISHLIRWEGLTKKKIYKSDRQIYELIAPRLNYIRLLNFWEEILTPASLTVIPYEKENLVGKSTINDFLHRFSLNGFSLPPSQQSLENVSLSQELIELKKTLNETPKSKAKEEAVIKVLNQLNHSLGSGINYRISDDLRSKTLKDFKGCNKLLSSRYNNPNRFFFASGQESKLHNVSQEEVEELAKIFNIEYSRFQTKAFIAKRFFARFLRNQLPFLHAFCKKIVSLFINKQSKN